MYTVEGFRCVSASEDVVEEAIWSGVSVEEEEQQQILTLIAVGGTVRPLLPPTGTGWIRES